MKSMVLKCLTIDTLLVVRNKQLNTLEKGGKSVTMWSKLISLMGNRWTLYVCRVDSLRRTWCHLRGLTAKNANHKEQLYKHKNKKVLFSKKWQGVLYSSKPSVLQKKKKSYRNCSGLKETTSNIALVGYCTGEKKMLERTLLGELTKLEYKLGWMQCCDKVNVWSW